MRFIPTRIHAVIDYLVGALLLWSPRLFHFGDYSAAMWVPVVLGLVVILYSLCTKYELGVFRVFPMPTHLVLDIIGGVLLAISPWVLGFADRVFWPHLIIGIAEIVIALLTKTRTSADNETT